MSKEQIRQLDGSGRIVIPKEIREELELNDQPLRIKEDKRRISVIKTNLEETEEKHVKTLDDEGRLLLPSDLRDYIGWQKGVEITFSTDKDTVILQEANEQCIICGRSDAYLYPVKQRLLCEECLVMGNQEAIEAWKTNLNPIFENYFDHCHDSIGNEENRKHILQARMDGRRLKTVLEFIGVDEDNELLEQIKKSYQLLGDVGKYDVFVTDLEKMNENKEESDEDIPEVYEELTSFAQNKRNESQEKLNKKLPKTVNNDLKKQWETFLNEGLPEYVRGIDTNEKLKEEEDKFHKKLEEYKKAKEEDASLENGLPVIKGVYVQAKHLRSLYTFLNKMKDGEYEDKVNEYEEIQKEFGKIISLRDRLDRIDKARKKAKLSKSKVKEIKKEIKGDLEKELNEVSG
ncbi:AbrB/MazE/SpoVT family DNA-binding domain-containing protein [Bacillus sp. FJAT-44742]|uniref:AbrB/MazE/SpoVT family DNA-binding domain-containing protein n=1 Tax=Bacillus sp. FJAT-44742 TaxID=2014005 RepID=UPI000C235404|nr:AbrB/MazE/SpoVT family DNA-binding domain-containing protein [Bacillus sp. FJAT-44742]